MLIVVHTRFPKSQYLLESVIFIIGSQYCQLFSLAPRLTLLFCDKMSARYPDNFENLCQLFFSMVEMVFRRGKKAASWTGNSSEL